MYKTLNNIPNILEEATVEAVEIDRKWFVPYLTAIESYALKNHIQIGGDIGQSLILKEAQSLKNYYFILYTYDAWKHAQAIMATLFDIKPPERAEIIIPEFVELGGGNTKAKSAFIAELASTRTINCMLKTIIEYKEFAIFVENREIVRCRQFERHNRAGLLQDIVPPVVAEGYFTHQSVQILSPLHYITEIYHQLYKPYVAWPPPPATYTELLQNEQKMFALFTETMGKLYPPTSTQEQTAYLSSELDHALLNKYIANSEIVVVGDYAIDYYESKDIFVNVNPKHKYKNRIQIITSIEPQDILKDLKKILPKYIFKEEIKMINLPNDFLLTKHTISSVNRENVIPIFDVYNSTDFELIPYIVQGGIKIASLFAIVRFKLIDIWAIALINRITPNPKYIATLNRTMNQVVFCREKIMTLLETPEVLFQTNSFMGKQINIELIKKKLTDKHGDRYQLFDYMANHYKESEMKD